MCLRVDRRLLLWRASQTNKTVFSIFCIAICCPTGGNIIEISGSKVQLTGVVVTWILMSEKQHQRSSFKKGHMKCKVKGCWYLSKEGWRNLSKSRLLGTLKLACDGSLWYAGDNITSTVFTSGSLHVLLKTDTLSPCAVCSSVQNP